ncbi:MAG: hypothetical protein IPM21_02745 [Acidobacteria bacterium]|nr:hypothetical protein [Acidobacteriota bacterium]
MKIFVLFIFLCTGWVSGFAQEGVESLKIGQVLPARFLAFDSSEPMRLISTSTSGFDPYVTINEKGVAFDVVYRGDDRKIVQIRSKDPNFETEDGLKVDCEIEVAKEDFFWIWQLEIRAPATKDGWHPFVGYDIEGIERKLNFVDQLSPGEKTKVKILGFIKDQYSLGKSRRDSR